MNNNSLNIEKRIYDRFERDVKLNRYIKLSSKMAIIIFIVILNLYLTSIPKIGLYYLINNIIKIDFISFIISLIPSIFFIILTVKILNKKDNKVNNKEKFLDDFNYINNI